MPQKDILAPLADDPLWYKDAIIYQLHVKAFFDHNDDGMGDFQGLTASLDYIQSLGVNAVWLLPFYPSPLRDDGYDIADYRNVHPDYGTLRDFRIFVREAHRRGIRIITELVVNHTSDQHPWFQTARKARPNSAKRNYYIWSDTDHKFPETRIIFTDTESSNWAWDPVAQAYYWHRFFSHQPDLNHNNPQVVKSVQRVMKFWLDMGVDGLRLDATPYLCVREGTNNENLPETHAVLKQLRAYVEAHYRNRMLLGEANQWPEDVRDYFGDGDECHMNYHFPLMPRIYMAVAQEDRHPIVEIMLQTPEIPGNCQWTIFLRNHDELTLEMVTDKERDYMYSMYAADRRMRLNVGIRRRLAPLMDNDIDKIRLLNSLLLSMPGSPIIYYGDELGMGDNIFLGDRNGVRTPMQWSPDRNAGFSKTDPARLYLPPIMDPIYGYQAVNVEAQSRDSSSLLTWMKRIIAVRKAHISFGRGELKFLHPGNRKILAYLRIFDSEVILCVANLAHSAQPVELNLSNYAGHIPVELLGQTVFPPIGELPYLLTLPGYGFYWFQLATDAEVPAWHEEAPPRVAFPIIVLFDGWRSFFPERVEMRRHAMAEAAQRQLAEEVLPEFLAKQRWFAAKEAPITRVLIVEQEVWEGKATRCLFTLLEVHCEGLKPQAYFLPLTLLWGDEEEERIRALFPRTIAKIRQRERLGFLVDGFADPVFCKSLIEAIGEGRELAYAHGTVRCSATSVFEQLVGSELAEAKMRTPATEGTNTTVILDNKLFLKGYRHVRQGVNPELEMGRFLTEIVRFRNSVPVAGAIEYIREDGVQMTLALLQAYIGNQGDGWTYSMDYLERYLHDKRLLEESEPHLLSQGVHETYMATIRTLGTRTGELHLALCEETGDPAFDPEPLTCEDLETWSATVHREAEQSFGLLERSWGNVQERFRTDAQTLLERREEIFVAIDRLAAVEIKALKTRFHGDYHLGQVLLVENDFFIIDFEGEPDRPLAERRQKHSPFKDVAGMLRSFNYAAYAALLKITAKIPEDFPILEPFVRDYEDEAVEAFMLGYMAATTECPSSPADPDHTRMLIDFFVLEKALYELRYELNNRPDWVGIPIKGIICLLGEEEEHR
jgi:maltose alpha-D-glucosyltransferase/alpha-amylase